MKKEKKALSAQRKRQIRNIIMFFLCCIFVSLVVLVVLYTTKVVYYDSGLKFNTAIFENIRHSVWLPIVFILLQVLITTLLCFIPATSAMMIGVSIALFGANYKAFLISFAGVILSSFLMDAIGRIGGSKIVTKLIGEDDYKKATGLITEKGYTYLPLMYLLPLFPDDALCFVAGVTKIKLWYHYLIILLCRGLGCATIVFGISFLPVERFIPITQSNIYDWVVLIGVILAYVMALLKISRIIDKKVTAKIKARKELKGDK